MTPSRTRIGRRWAGLHWLMNAALGVVCFLPFGNSGSVAPAGNVLVHVGTGSPADEQQSATEPSAGISEANAVHAKSVPATALKSIFAARDCYSQTSGLSDWFMNALGIDKSDRERLSEDMKALDLAHHSRNQPEPMAFKDTRGRPVFGLRSDPASVQALEREVAALLVAAGASSQSRWAASVIAMQIAFPGGPQSTAFTAARGENGISLQWFRIDGSDFIPTRQSRQSGDRALHPMIARALE